jgi:hypothetical protein
VHEFSAQDIGLAPLQVHVDPDPVSGAPLHLAIEVRTRGRHVQVNGLPCVDWFGLEGAVGIEMQWTDLAGASGDLRVSAQAFDGRTTYSLHDGQTRRMLVDVSEHVDGVLAAAVTEHRPWRARMVVSYGCTDISTSSAPFLIQSRAPHPRERAVLERLQRDRRAAGSWGAWSRTPALAAVSIEPLRDGPGALWFCAAMRALMFDTQPLSAADLSLAASVPDFYAPERQVIECEVRQGLGLPIHPQDAPVDPGVAHRMAALAAGEGWLRWRACAGTAGA